VCALTFARRFLYNTSELPRDGASAVADQMSWIYGGKDHLQEAPPKIEGLRGGGRSSGMLFSFAEYPSLNELSKGMSNDYHVAVEEGATMMRVDRAFGGARHA
jgi:hypothetical protein